MHEFLYPDEQSPPALTPAIVPAKATFLVELWKSLRLDNDITRTHDRICPHCHLPLPHALAKGQASSHTIAIVGEGASGKSAYFGVLAHQLIENPQMAEAGLAAWPQDSFDAAGVMKACTSVLWRDRYGTYLFPDDPSSQRSVPPTTDTRATNKSVRTPLIYRIQDFSTARNSPYSHSKAVDFVVYDAAGEDIENKRNMERWGRYITESSAILFLIDPSRFAHVRNSLADVDTGTSRTGRSSAVLDYIVDRFERQQLLSPTDPIPVPIVFSIMKSDLLKTILPQSSRIPLDSYHRGGVDLEDIQLVSQEIESLLHGWGEGNFLAKCRRFSNSCFCAVSAVGEQPGPDNTFSDLRPIRVLDPLFWILHKLGYARAIS